MRASAHTVDLPGGTFHYLSWGAREAPPVLCLHGFPDHPHSWAAVAEHLADAGYRVLAPWMRGYFPSVTAGPYDIERLACDVLELAEELSPDDPIGVVGHDWGAVATYAAISEAPERFLCAVTLSVPHPLVFLRALRNPSQLRRSWYMLFFQLPLLPERSMRRGRYALVDRLWRDWSPGYRLPDEDRDRLVRCLAASMPAPIEYYRAATRSPRDTLERLRRDTAPIEVPVRYLHGADDGCIAPEAAEGQERFFEGPLDSAVIADAGHFLQLERPGAVALQIEGWLERHRR